MKLTQAFYHRDTRLVAQALLGKYLVRFQDGLPLVVRIQETEAYIGRMDKACHAYNYRRTPPDGDLIRPAGHRLYLSHLWYVSLPEFCDRARGRALCRPDPGRSAPGKSFLSGPEPIWRRLGAVVCLSEKEFSQRAGQTLPGSGAHPG